MKEIKVALIGFGGIAKSHKNLKECIDDRHFGALKSLFMDRLSGLPKWGFGNWFRDTERSGWCIMDMHIPAVIHRLEELGYESPFTIGSEIKGDRVEDIANARDLLREIKAAE